MEFAGTSADAALGAQAKAQFLRLWNMRRRIVHFETDGTIASVPIVFTVGEDEMLARTDLIEALRLRDPEQRALAIASFLQGRARVSKGIQGRQLRLDLYDRVIDALKHGAVAYDDPTTGEIIVRNVLPAAETDGE
jgi:hypothetical protein